MSWRTIVISKCSKLDLQLNRMVVRQVDQEVKISLKEIALLIIESTAVSITAALLVELNKQKIKVVFCDETHSPYFETIPYHGSHDSSSKIKRQIKWKAITQSLLWKEIVKNKIQQQAQFLEELNQAQAAVLYQYATEVQPNDKTNREAHAAKTYFEGVFGIDFTRSSDHPLNAALNYGYGIILAIFNREIVSTGYLTQLGIFHKSQFNPYNLSSDLMEPFRILVDRKIYAMAPKSFGIDEKREIMTLLEDRVCINNRKNYLAHAIKIYCHSIFDVLDQDDVSLVRFYRNE